MLNSAFLLRPDGLMEHYDTNPARVLGYTEYDSDEIGDELTERLIEWLIARSNRRMAIEYDLNVQKQQQSIRVASAASNCFAALQPTREDGQGLLSMPPSQSVCSSLNLVFAVLRADSRRAH
jgi:hypothetical protein